MRSDGCQLSYRDDLQGDGAGHLVTHLATLLPQLKLLRLDTVLHRAGEHYLAHELVFDCVTVPHLASTGTRDVTYSTQYSS